MSDDLELTPEQIQELASLPEVQQAVGAMGGYPDPPSKESLMKFFRDILAFTKLDYDKISKTGNLSVGEIGFLSLPTRNYLSLANYVEVEGWDKVAGYLRMKANIVSGTSLSKKALLLNLAITQKRVSKSLGAPSREVKTGLFGKTEVVKNVEED